MRMPRPFSSTARFVSATAKAPPHLSAPNLGADALPAPARDHGSVGKEDMAFANRLPEAASAILLELSDAAFDAGTIGLGLHNRMLDLREAVGRIEQRLSLISQPQYQNTSRRRSKPKRPNWLR
ncbi:hypothetical protein [Bradyrhizobium viridifuturi]|uniref:hypothetical protein n=1 Tax=Bradyrhizobium viridifuturi TaxID=1654716 RepID=UPI00067E9FD8|nr:hypothetical protein [Bradyrhizobium viridifuturi]